jgi:hypothetical protein
MPADHADAHECVCGGSWLGCIDEPGFAIVRLPGSAPDWPPGGGTDYFACECCGETTAKSDVKLSELPVPPDNRAMVCDGCRMTLPLILPSWHTVGRHEGGFYRNG